MAHAQGVAEHVADKGFRRQHGKGLGKADHHQAVHFLLPYQGALLFKGRDQRGRYFGRQQGQGVGLKGDHHRRERQAGALLFQVAQKRHMAAVDTVEITDGDNRIHEVLVEYFRSGQYAHGSIDHWFVWSIPCRGATLPDGAQFQALPPAPQQLATQGGVAG